MKKLILAITLVSIVLLLSTCAKRKEGYSKLKYQAVDTSESTISYACQDQMKLEEKPTQLKDFPKKISGLVFCFLAKMADKDIPLIIDYTNNCTLYLDTDADGFLSDERGYTSKAVKRRIFGSVDYYRYGPISVEFDQADGKFIKRIYVISHDEKMRYVTFCPADYRKGKVLLGDAIYKVRVLDGNFDGKYDKIFSPPVERIWRPGCDSFAIDFNRNGKIDFDYYHYSELMPLAKMVKVGDSYYSINVAEGGQSLELNKIQPDLGTLDLRNEKVKLKLWSDAAQQFFPNIKNSVKIPAGKYQALFVEFSQIDSKKIRVILLAIEIQALLKILRLLRTRQLHLKSDLHLRLRQLHGKVAVKSILILLFKGRPRRFMEPTLKEMVYGCPRL